MGRLSVLGYASGSPMSHIVMRRIAVEHDLLAIVTPAEGWRARLKRIMHRRVWRDVPGRMIEERQAARYAPDLIVVASYPKILTVAALSRARIGALNVHTALLPRHRGIDPIFSTYWHDDVDTGVTIHWMDAGVDSGDIAAQQAIPLVRAKPSRELYFELAERAATMMATLLQQVSRGERPRTPQSADDATVMNAADIRRARVPLSKWPAERVYHVLRGLDGQGHRLVADMAGVLIPDGRATGWRARSDVQPGRVVAVDGGCELHCSDGTVSVELDLGESRRAG